MKALVWLAVTGAINATILTFTVLAEDGIIIGSYTNEPSYNIDGYFGVEQWEGGKKSNFRHELWRLDCYNPTPPKMKNWFDTRCNLERTVIDYSEKYDRTAYIGIHEHSVRRGNLKLDNVDWEEGKLDLKIQIQATIWTDVMIRLSYSDNYIYLKSLRAVGTVNGMMKDNIYMIENRIPEYTYRINVPIEIRGFKPESQKEKDEFLKSLSLADREVFSRMGKISEPRLNKDKIREVLPHYDEIINEGRDFTATEDSLLVRTFWEVVEKRINTSQLSDDGRRKVLERMRSDKQDFSFIRKRPK